MSAIFGIVDVGGMPVNEAYIFGMREKLIQYGQDGYDIVINEGAGLGCCLSKFGVCSQADIPVYRNETGAYLVCDALLWNRAELIDTLGVDSGISTQALLMKAYQKWGENCPKHINGDFAFAVWDKEENRLFLARDHLGVRPLYYFYSGSLFAFATDYRALLCLPFVSRQLDEVKLFALCSYTYHIEPQRTYFQQIQKLPMAHTLCIGPDGMQIQKYWTPGMGEKITYETEAEYKAALYAIVSDAVNLRINGVSGKVGAELSGGLDSSVITILASRELQKQNRVLAGAFSWSPQRDAVAMQEGDERLLIEAVCEAEGLACGFMDPAKGNWDGKGALLTEGGRGVAFRQELPYFAEQGAGFVLSGWGGDQGISHRANMKEYFFNGLWRPFFREARYAANGSCVKFVKTVASSTVMRFFGPFSVFDTSRRNIPNIIRRNFKQSVKKRCKRNMLYFTIDPVKHIESGNIQSRTELTAWADAPYNMQHLFPFLDFRVMDFAMSIPREWYYKNGLNRYIFRKAFMETLPPCFAFYNRKNDPAITHNFFKKKPQNDAAARTEADQLKEELFSPYIDLQMLRKAAAPGNKEDIIWWANFTIRKCMDIQRMLAETETMDCRS